MKPTITIHEANNRVQQYLDQAADEVFPPPTTRQDGMAEQKGDCSDPDDNGPTNRLQASREYELLGVDPGEFPRYFDALHQWLDRHNFAVAFDKENQGGRLLGGENRTDGFSISLQSNDSGGLYLTTASPCVWPNGTPEPEPSEGQ